MNKKLMKYLSLGLLAAAVLCGSVYAYMFRITNNVENVFVPAQVDCTVAEEFDGTQKTSVTVKNTGNIKAYIRVRLVSYWVNEDDIVSKPSEMPVVQVTDEWVSDTANNTYYHKKPVKSGEFTSELLRSEITLVSEDGYSQVVEIFAEAIQAEPTDAVTAAWNVNLDSDSGNIISLK